MRQPKRRFRSIFVNFPVLSIDRGRNEEVSSEQVDCIPQDLKDEGITSSKSATLLHG